MANQEHLDILKKGVTTWNQWRHQHPEIHIDLSRTNLCGIYLSEANFCRADLCGTDLCRAHLSEANLSEANLSEANLSWANLSWANLSWANLKGANLSRTDLRRADLRKADLRKTYLSGAYLKGAYLKKAYLNEALLTNADLNEADLSGTLLTNADLTNADLTNANLNEADLSGTLLTNADLTNADLSGAYLHSTNLTNVTTRYTIFTNLDLSEAKGLDTIQHNGPSSIGIDTIYRSKGTIPEAFLKGAGVDNTFIEYIHSLTQKPIDYYSCFISYSSKDQPFAERLFADLQSKNVRCWFAPHHMKIGEKIIDRIDISIRLYDKLLLILSQDSVESHWVEREVGTALDKEREGHPNILFPVRIDETIMSKKIGWANHIRTTRHIGDFTRWKEHDAYQQAFQRLLQDLKQGI